MTNRLDAETIEEMDLPFIIDRRSMSEEIDLPFIIGGIIEETGNADVEEKLKRRRPMLKETK